MQNTIKIVADENIPVVEKVFKGLGSVTTLPGRDIARGDVMDADVLLVRSVTPVNEKLLAGSAVRFVGTATIGTDHVDEEYLRRAGVEFSAAPGSNANSVAEYITAALLTLACRRAEPLAGRSIGVVGVGNVGGNVAEKARALGMTVVKNDPPLARRTGDRSFRTLEEAIQCDYVTLHVPLEKEGRDPTFQMVDRDFLDAMSPRSVLLNSSRGAVVREPDLKDALGAGAIGGAALDVWENEPQIDPDLVALADLATPHIAGYSFDGKFAGVRMLYHALCHVLDTEPEVDFEALKPPPPARLVEVAEAGGLVECLHRTIKILYDIEEDDRKLRGLRSLPPQKQGPHFDGLRAVYPVRREFHSAAIRPGTERELCFGAKARDILHGLGFKK